MRQEERLQRCTLAAGLCSLATVVLLETGGHSFAAVVAVLATACLCSRPDRVPEGAVPPCVPTAWLKAFGLGAQTRRASQGRWCAC